MTHSVRDSFVQRFGEDEASRIEGAAFHHANGINSEKQGSDPFKWAICICIGYECFSSDRYRAWHKITTPHEQIKDWIIKECDLVSHDGDIDYLGAAIGLYDPYIKAPSCK